MIDRFLRACRRQTVDCPPVWFMRQAGRFLPEYRALRAKYDFLTMCKTPDLATKVTLLPVDILGVDAAIMFGDIMLSLEGMGIELTIKEGEGPVIQHPVRSMVDVGALQMRPPQEAVPYVLETIRLTRRELAGKVPLVGFAGAPFTLASYMIEGRSSRDFSRTKSMMFRAPDVWHALMEKLTAVTLAYLQAQVQAGAQAVQLFDSWVGCLAPDDYDAYVLPYVRRIMHGLDGAGVPRILFGTGTATLLPSIATAGADVIGVDWRLRLDQASDIVGSGVALQGNLDPAVLLAPPSLVAQRTRAVLQQAQGRLGHIFNLGHGVLPDTPVEMAIQVVEQVHDDGR